MVGVNCLKSREVNAVALSVLSSLGVPVSSTTVVRILIADFDEQCFVTLLQRYLEQLSTATITCFFFPRSSRKGPRKSTCICSIGYFGLGRGFL